MCQSRGLMYHVFGREYDKVAARTVLYSRKFTSLPICVVTNLNANDRDPVWDQVSDVIFFRRDWTVDDNRDVKTKLVEYSPFDQTLYIDSDAVIQKIGIEILFSFFEYVDMVLQLNSVKRASDSPFFTKHYVPLFEKVGIKFPVRVYQGGFFAFKKTHAVVEFFNSWNAYWRLGGRGRDMPAMVCAAKIAVDVHGLKVQEVNEREHKFFASGGCTDHGNPDAIIQHRWSRGTGFFKTFRIPPYKPHKPFDGRGELIYGGG